MSKALLKIEIFDAKLVNQNLFLNYFIHTQESFFIRNSLTNSLFCFHNVKKNKVLKFSFVSQVKK